MCVLAVTQVVVGNLRVTAVSSSLVRVEPKGPNGFEDRTTFMVVDRAGFAGIPIAVKSDTPTMTTLTTSSYNVLLMKTGAPPTPPHGPTCAGRSPKRPNPHSRPHVSVSPCYPHAASCTT